MPILLVYLKLKLNINYRPLEYLVLPKPMNVRGVLRNHCAESGKYWTKVTKVNE